MPEAPRHNCGEKVLAVVDAQHQPLLAHVGARDGVRRRGRLVLGDYRADPLPEELVRLPGALDSLLEFEEFVHQVPHLARRFVVEFLGRLKLRMEERDV